MFTGFGEFNMSRCSGEGGRAEGALLGVEVVKKESLRKSRSSKCPHPEECGCESCRAVGYGWRGLGLGEG